MITTTPQATIENTQEPVRWGFIPVKQLMPFFLVTLLFLMWGIPNNLNDILITHFMKSFEISRFQAGLVQFAFYMGYFILAIPSGLMMKRFSYKTGLVTGLLLFALGCALFYPAAISGTYTFFLLALFVIAAGLTFLETGANLFIVKLGPNTSSERRLNFSQAFNPLGAILGVLLGTIFILSGVEHSAAEVAMLKETGQYEAYLQHETMRVVMPYLILGGVALLFAILFICMPFPTLQQETHAVDKDAPQSVRQLIKIPHFRKGVWSQFFYCGAQTCTWSFFIQYVQDFTGQPEKVAGYFLTGTLVAFGVGRFVASYLMRTIQPAKLMAIFGFANIGLVFIAILFPGIIGVWAIFLTSFFMSLMYPTNFALSIRNLGSQSKMGGSFLVMAIVGGALLPPLMGWMAETTNMAWAMVIPFIAYIYITYYAMYCSKQFKNQ